MRNYHTTDEIFAPVGPFIPEEPAIRFLDIHIYEQEPEPEEPPSVESQPEPTLRDESDLEDTEAVPSHRKRRTTILALCLSLVSFAVVGLVVVVYVLPLLTPDATITIVPSTQQIRTTTSITVTTGAATGTQLQGRALAALTMNQAQTIPTTGKGHQDAKAGHGYITFYNAAPYSQTVTAGTMVTGADGVQIVTEQDTSIPAASYPIFGQASVPAQAIIPGPGGNIRAGDIYGPCCRLNLSAVNSAFEGGQEARDYQTATQQDINTVVKSIQTSLIQGVQAALQTQVRTDETLITPFPCQ